MVYNLNNLNLKSGFIERATDWAGNTFANGSGANEDSILSALEAYTYKNIGLFTGLQFVHSQEDEKIINTDACDVGEISRTSVLTPRAEFTRQEVDNLTEIANMYGLNTFSENGTTVNEIGEAIGTNATAGQIYVIANTSYAAGQPVVVANVVVDLGGTPLVLNTDYTIEFDADGSIVGAGKSYIVFILPQTGVLDIDYDYDPIVSELMTYKVQARSIPYNLLRVTECPEDLTGNLEYNVYYLVKYAISSEMTQQLVNTKLNDFEGAPVVFTVADGGNWFEKKGRTTIVVA